MTGAHEVYGSSVALLSEGLIDVATHRSTIASIKTSDQCSCKACDDWRTLLLISVQYEEGSLRLYSVDTGVVSAASRAHLGGLFIEHAQHRKRDEPADEPADEATDESEDEAEDESANKKELCPWGADRRWEIEAAAKYEAEQIKKQ